MLAREKKGIWEMWKWAVATWWWWGRGEGGRGTGGEGSGGRTRREARPTDTVKRYKEIGNNENQWNQRQIGCTRGCIASHRNESKREGIQNSRLTNERLSKGEKELRMFR